MILMHIHINEIDLGHAVEMKKSHKTNHYLVIQV